MIQDPENNIALLRTTSHDSFLIRLQEYLPPFNHGFENSANNCDLQITNLESNRNKALPEACIFVASLPVMLPDEVISECVIEHFSEWGNIISVKVSRDWKDRPFAFVQYENESEAKKALMESQHSYIRGRYIRVEKARVNRTLCVCKLQFTKELKSADIQEALETFGPIENFHMMHDYATGLYNGCAIAKFRYREDAIKAFTSLKIDINWHVEWTAQQMETQVDASCIFVGNLDKFMTNELLLKRIFSAYGSIVQMQYVDTKDSRPSFCFVKYEKAQEAENALEMDGFELMGKCLKVRIRNKMNPKSASLKIPQRPLSTGGAVRSQRLQLCQLSGSPILTNSRSFDELRTEAMDIPVSGDIICPFPRKHIRSNFSNPRNTTTVSSPINTCNQSSTPIEDECSDLLDQITVSRLKYFIHSQFILSDVDLSSSMKAKNEFMAIVRNSDANDRKSNRSKTSHHLGLVF